MKATRGGPSELAQRLSEAEATIQALLAGQIDAVVDVTTSTPVLLSKAQEALRQSEEQYRQIVEATSDGIVKVDLNARIVFGAFTARAREFMATTTVAHIEKPFESAGLRASVRQLLLTRRRT